MSADPKLVETLLSADDAQQRAEAAEQLARLGPEAAPYAAPLVRAAGDRAPEVRDWAIAALEELGPPPVEDCQPLAALAANPDVNIGYWAATLLGRLGDKAVPAVAALTESLAAHPEPAVCQRAAWALGQIGPGAQVALPALDQATARGDARLARLARRAIEQIQGTA